MVQQKPHGKLHPVALVWAKQMRNGELKFELGAVRLPLRCWEFSVTSKLKGMIWGSKESRTCYF